MASRARPRAMGSDYDPLPDSCSYPLPAPGDRGRSERRPASRQTPCKEGDSRLKLSEENYSERTALDAKAARVKEDLDLRL